MISARASLVIAMVAALLCFGAAAPAAAGCTEDADLIHASQECGDKSVSEVKEEKAKYPTSVWRVRQICKDPGRTPEGACFNPQECTTAAGEAGTRYNVYRDGAHAGTACLSAGEKESIEAPPDIRLLVTEAFETLDWHPSELTVQPPGGRTLVNFETNFYTTNSKPTSIPVRLVESNVVVTARPIAYRWNFGDGMSITTAGPGSPYPNLDVAHAYEQVETVAVSVDTQYGDASFTVDGGPPESIPSTLWVAGEAQDLQIVEALPQLVLQ
jgi:hypothetical protein